MRSLSLLVQSWILLRAVPLSTVGKCVIKLNDGYSTLIRKHMHRCVMVQEVLTAEATKSFQLNSSRQHVSWKKQVCHCLIRQLLLPLSVWRSEHCPGEDTESWDECYWVSVSCAICRLHFLCWHSSIWVGRFTATAALYSVDHQLQYHPSWDWFIKSRMGDSNSLHRQQPFPFTNINLHRKWNCDFAKTGSHCALGLICLKVSAGIKNLSTYTLPITKQYLLLPSLIVYDVFEKCVEEPCIPGIWDLAPELSCDLLILFKPMIAQDENMIYMTVVAKRFKLFHLKLNVFWAFFVFEIWI